MIDRETQAAIDRGIMDHRHDGNFSQRIDFFDIFGYTEAVFVQSATIATTGNTDTYFIIPRDMTLTSAFVSGTAALTADNTNYITFSMTNLGLDGAGTAALLAATDPNTTKSTGGSGLVADARRTLTVSTTPANLNVKQGDRIRIRAAATGTLANTVTFPVYQLIFQAP